MHKQGARSERVPDSPEGGREADGRGRDGRDRCRRRTAGRERAPPPRPLPAPPPTAEVVHPALSAEPQKPVTQRTGLLADAPAPASSGQTVATTVQLDENRYLRLADAGKPGPGRLKRRTIQEMVIEALDEWFEWDLGVRLNKSKFLSLDVIAMKC